MWFFVTKFVMRTKRLGDQMLEGNAFSPLKNPKQIMWRSYIHLIFSSFLLNRETLDPILKGGGATMVHNIEW